MPNLGTTELIIIAVVIMVLFGSKKLPGAARSLGQSMRIFKAETKGLRDDDKPELAGQVGADQGGHVSVSPAAAPVETPRDSTQA